MKIELKTVCFNFLVNGRAVSIYYVPFLTENNTQLFSCKIIYGQLNVVFATRYYPNKTNSIKLIKNKLQEL